ncbi:MAG: EF-P lysine aminoacylase EpmA [Pseudomonadota bacterium]|nr:EF-P lysine aminoacylase EpmA [Pseudomonadota bacterium]
MQEADWRPAAAPERLALRARVLAEVRDFFARRAVLEVETPLLSQAGTTDPNIESYTVADADGSLRFLQTSPEFAMKRMLSAGIGDIYQIGKAFRRAEAGRWHNPEFTLLEWYRTGFDHWRLMDEVEALCRTLLGDVIVGETHWKSYSAAFDEATGIDPNAPEPGAIADCAQALGLTTVESLDTSQWLDLFFSEAVARRFPAGRLTFIYDFPAEQASLARIRDGSPPVAERFEVFLGPMELGNGFHELTDAAEQHARFEAELKRRSRAGKAGVEMDRRLVAALQAGMPECAGVALGVDRMLMARVGATHIEEVIAFPWPRA